MLLSIEVFCASEDYMAENTAIKENKGQQYVQKMVNGKVENINITAGLIGEDRVEILSGLIDKGSSTMRSALGR